MRRKHEQSSMGHAMKQTLIKNEALARFTATNMKAGMQDWTVVFCQYSRV